MKIGRETLCVEREKGDLFFPKKESFFFGKKRKREEGLAKRKGGGKKGQYAHRRERKGDYHGIRRAAERKRRNGVGAGGPL